MSARDTDTRLVGLVDIPLVMRLTDESVTLDSAMGFTRDVQGPNGALLSSILLPQRGLHTLIARSDKQQVVGQFRFKPDDHNAHIIYVAPGLADGEDDTAWLHVFDAMAREAGKHQAHTLVAEVNEDSSLFETMRTCGFAVYARQIIWRRLPGTYQHPTGRLVTLTEQTEADIPGIMALFAATVPGLMQQIVTPSEEKGLVYRRDDRIEGYFSIYEGKHGIYVTPFLHTDIAEVVPDVFAALLRMIPRCEKLPIYVCVRRHQDWFTMSLHALGFEPGMQQAVMVRHLTAGVRHARFETVENGRRIVPIQPPTRPLRQIILQSKVRGEKQE